MTNSGTATFLAALLFAVTLTGALGDAPNPYVGEPRAKITPDGLEAGDRFGRALALDGSTLVLGSSLSDDQDGHVFVYEDAAAGADHVQTLSVDDATIDEPAKRAELGAAVALEGDLLVAGAPGVDTAERFEAGAAVVFEATDDGYQHLATLPSPDPQALDAFGSAVAIDGDHVAVSEPEDEVDDASNGAIHVYERSGDDLVHEDRLEPPADADTERLGVSLAFANGTLVAGAPEDATPAGEGAVYVYEEGDDGWTQTARLTAPENAEAEQLGRDVALEGDTIVAGAPGPQYSICCPSKPVPEGQAHTFELGADGWEHETELDPATSARGHGVGMSVALDGDRAFVGAPSAPADSVYGTVSVFAENEDGWTETGRIASPDPASGDRFAKATVAEDGLALVGASGDDEAGHNAGAGYVFANPLTD